MIIYTIATQVLLDPLAWTFLLLIGALIAGHYHRAGLQRGLLLGASLLVLGFLILPLGAWLTRPLEDTYSRPALPRHVDGIVILDGGVHSAVFLSRGVSGENVSLLRMVAGVALMRLYPNAMLVYSGAAGNRARQLLEHKAADHLFLALGVPAGRTTFEPRSRNTWENLSNSYALVHPRPGQVWVLVTSAMHMPRAMGVARKLGWRMIPWPSDYVTARSGGWRVAPAAENLIAFDRALHEWVGLLAYRLSGRFAG